MSAAGPEGDPRDGRLRHPDGEGRRPADAGGEPDERSRDGGLATGRGSLRVGSLFSGVGGFDLGLERAGHSVLWQCEFEPFRRRVLRHRFPGIPVFDDVRYIGTGVAERPEPKLFCRDGDPASPPAIDLLCGGFPCQDLSVAGRRAGLHDGERSRLFFEFARCADEFVRPGGFILIENVPGLLSSNDGRDFAVVLATLAELGFYDLAYRVLDSRHFGVAQRRRRVFILGRRASGRVCAEVLLEHDGGHRHPPTSWEARARATASARGDAALHGGTGERVAATLTSGSHPGSAAPGRRREDDINLVDARSVHDRIEAGDLTQSLTTRYGTTGADLPDAEANWLVPDQRPDAVRPDVVGGITRRYGKGTDSDATDALILADDLREGAGSTPRGRRRELEASGREPDADGLRGRSGEGLDAGGSGAGSGAPAHPDGVRAAPRVPRRLDDGAAEVAQTLTVHNTAKGIGQAPDEKDYVVVPGEPEGFDAYNQQPTGDTAATLDVGSNGSGPHHQLVHQPVEHYAVRGRDGGAQLEPTDLPNVRGHTGKDGGGHDHLIHDQRQPPEAVGFDTYNQRATGDVAPTLPAANDAGGFNHAMAFLPRHYTRGKDGAPDSIVPPITKESDRGDGMAVVHTYNVQPANMPPDEFGKRNGLEARETDHAETITTRQGSRSERGTLAQVPCIHPDAVGRDGVSRTAGPDADGYVRQRDAGLGVIDDGTSYTLNTGAPPAVLAPGIAEGTAVPLDLQPDGQRFAAMGDAITVNISEWLGVRLRSYLERHGSNA